MTELDLGPCMCEAWLIVGHEHSDFPPYPCAEPGCGCEAWTEPGQNRAQINADGSDAGSAGVRKGVTLPAHLDFASERVTAAASWLDRMVTGVRQSGSSGVDDDALAVCALADLIEQLGPEDVDPIDALAVAVRRLAARPRMNAREALEHMRRKVRR